MKNVFTKILLKIINHKLLIDSLNVNYFLDKARNKKIDDCLKKVTMNDKGQFYEEAFVCNMQNNPSKIVIGANTHIRGFLQIFKQGGLIEIGENCYVGENTKIWSADSIKIGNRVLIAHGVNIHDNISHPLNFKDRHNDYLRILGLNNLEAERFDLRVNPVVIKDDVWIGFNSTILKGVTIGKGSIIGACSLVTKDVPDWTIVAGNPARVIRIIPENER